VWRGKPRSKEEKIVRRKRQICHLMDMIECCFNNSSPFDLIPISTASIRGTISLITLIDYNINCTSLREVIADRITRTAFVLSADEIFFIDDALPHSNAPENQHR